MVFRSAIAGAFLFAVPVRIPLSLTAQLLPYDQNISHSIKVNPDFSATIFYNDGKAIIKIELSPDDYIDLRRRRQEEGGNINVFYDKYLRKRVEAAIDSAKKKTEVPTKKPGVQLSSVDLTHLDEARRLLDKFDKLMEPGNTDFKKLAQAHAKYDEAQAAFGKKEFENALVFAKDALGLKAAAIEEGNRNARDKEVQDRAQASLARNAAQAAKWAASDIITPYYHLKNKKYQTELQSALDEYSAGLALFRTRRASASDYIAAKEKFESALTKAQQAIGEIEESKKAKPAVEEEKKPESIPLTLRDIDVSSLRKKFVSGELSGTKDNILSAYDIMAGDRTGKDFTPAISELKLALLKFNSGITDLKLRAESATHARSALQLAQTAKTPAENQAKVNAASLLARADSSIKAAYDGGKDVGLARTAFYNGSVAYNSAKTLHDYQSAIADANNALRLVNEAKKIELDFTFGNKQQAANYAVPLDLPGFPVKQMTLRLDPAWVKQNSDAASGRIITQLSNRLTALGYTGTERHTTFLAQSQTGAEIKRIISQMLTGEIKAPKGAKEFKYQESETQDTALISFGNGDLTEPHKGQRISYPDRSVLIVVYNKEFYNKYADADGTLIPSLKERAIADITRDLIAKSGAIKGLDPEQISQLKAEIKKSVTRIVNDFFGRKPTINFGGD